MEIRPLSGLNELIEVFFPVLVGSEAFSLFQEMAMSVDIQVSARIEAVII